MSEADIIYVQVLNFKSPYNLQYNPFETQVFKNNAFLYHLCDAGDE